MALSLEDRELLESMKQREFNLKKRQRAANSVHLELRRYQLVMILLAALVFAALLDAVVLIVESTYVPWAQLWRHAIAVFVVATVLGLLAGPGLVRTSFGRRLLGRKEVSLGQKYSGDLHAGRRWAQFYYRGEDISAYIGQILYTVEAEHRFDSVAEALASAKAHAGEHSAFRQRALALFDEVVAQTDLLVLSSIDEAGAPSNRFMRFVRTDQPGVWYVTTAPDAPKVHELDVGRVALVTAPTEAGATISSNRVTIRRSESSFNDIAHLYRDQVPRYLDGMTQEDQQREVVYELCLQSAKIDSWVDHGLVVFDRP